MTLLRDGATKRQLCVVTFFLYNFYMCFHGNGANTMYNSVPPSNAEYFPLDEHFEAAPTELEDLNTAQFASQYHWGNGQVH